MHRRTTLILSTGAVTVALAAPVASASQPMQPRWTVTSTWNPSPQANYLTSALSFADNDVWAVGAWYRPQLSTPGTLTEHWNGSRWKLVPSPNVTDGYNELYGIAGVTPGDIWAVGYDNISAYGSERTLAEHWNGREWRVVATPNLGDSANELEGVHAVASDDVWAVGFGNDPGGFAGHAIALHWNGKAWRLHDLTPKGAHHSDLLAVTAVSANDVWAVGSQDGNTLVEHFDGTSWRVIPSPNGEGDDSVLSGVVALGPQDVWAVGASESSGGPGVEKGDGTLAMHWDGTSWRVVPSPNGPHAGNALLNVIAFGPDDVWAAGYSYDDLEVTAQTLMAHWDGTSWRLVKTPNPGPDYNVLDGLAGLDAKHLWAIGAAGPNTLAMHD